MQYNSVLVSLSFFLENFQTTSKLLSSCIQDGAVSLSSMNNLRTLLNSGGPGWFADIVVKVRVISVAVVKKHLLCVKHFHLCYAGCDCFRRKWSGISYGYVFIERSNLFPEPSNNCQTSLWLMNVTALQT